MNLTQLEISRICSINWTILPSEIYETLDLEFIRRLISKKHRIYVELPLELQKNTTLIFEALKGHDSLFENIPLEYIDKNTILQIFSTYNIKSYQKNKNIISFIKKYENDIEFLEQLVYLNPDLFSFCPKSINQNNELIKKIISENDERKANNKKTLYPGNLSSQFYIQSPRIIEDVIRVDYSFFPSFKHNQFSIDFLIECMDYTFFNLELGYSFFNNYIAAFNQNPQHIEIIIQNMINKKYYTNEKFISFLEAFINEYKRHTQFGWKPLEILKDYIAEEDYNRLFNLFENGYPYYSDYNPNDCYLPETNPKYKDIIEKTSNLVNCLPEKEKEFFLALKKNHEELKENSIFSKYFSGVSFYDNKDVISHYLQYFKNEILSTLDYSDFTNLLLSKAEILFTYENHNTELVVLMNNSYFNVDDECLVYNIGNHIYELPLTIYDFRDEDNEDVDFEEFFSEYRTFCNQFGFDFNIEDYQKTYTQEDFHLIENETINIVYQELLKFIQLLDEKIHSDFYDIFKPGQSYIPKFIPEKSFIFKHFEFHNRTFAVSKDNAVFEIVNNEYIPYSEKFHNLPFYFFTDMMISEDLYEKYKEWCHSMNYLIHPYFLNSENYLFSKNLELFKKYYIFK